MWKFTIWDIDSGGSFTDIDEPVGWDGITLRLRRDRDWHGFFEFMDDEISTLQFDGEARDILANAFEDKGIEARVVLIIQYLCSGTTYDLLWTGFFDFTTYKFVCGDRCYIEINATADNCLMKLRNRYDQKVDIGSLQTFDGSPLVPYDLINVEMELPPVGITLMGKGIMPEDETVTIPNVAAVGLAKMNGIYSPLLSTNTDELPEYIGGLQGMIAGNELSEENTPLEIYEFTAIPLCATAEVEIKVRFKGQLADMSTATRECSLSISVFKDTSYLGSTLLNGPSNVVIHYTGSGARTDAFDYNWTGTTTLSTGEKIWVVLVVLVSHLGGGSVHNPVLDIEKGGYVSIASYSICNATDAKVYMVNETLSRVTEIITDDCLRVYSDYFGRPNSQPYDTADYGCGSLEVLTNGLAIRGATLIDNSEPKMTVSLKELFDGLNAIHNIGMGLENDMHRTGYQCLRIEPYQYFYNDTVVFTAENVAELEIEVRDDQYISKVLMGYTTWETENINGAFDIHTKREYRTSLAAARNTYDRQCKFIASGYTIEITRREFGKTTKDWKYDDKTFIICVIPQDDFPYCQVDHGDQYYGIRMPENVPPMFGTMYNTRISPARNAMRHFRTILQSYADTTGILYYSAGEGNVLASYAHHSPFCRLEAVDSSNRPYNITENANIDTASFFDDILYLPVFKNQLVRFDYPLSYEQFKTIQANPYGLIEYSCANGPMQSGWIENLKYSPEKGMASFEIKPKYFQ